MVVICQFEKITKGQNQLPWVYVVNRDPSNVVWSQRHTMLVFLLDYLRFRKLLKLHQTEDRISNNLLNACNPAGKQASYAADLKYI